MINVRKYTSGDIATWNKFVKSSKNGIFMFERGYVEYHSDRFVDESLLFTDEERGGELVAVLPASRHDDVLRSHGGLTYGGFITDSSMKQHRMDECFVALRDYCGHNGISGVLYKCIPHIYHSMPAEEDRYSLWRNDAILVKREVSTTIDLACPAKMPKGRKAQISRARREGLVVSESTNFDAFVKLERRILQERHNVEIVHTAEELKLLAMRFPEGIKLYTVERNGELLGATVLFVYKNVVHTQYMANSDVGCEIGALDLLISELIKRYAAEKRYFDFGISTECGGKILNPGLIAHKEGFGGRTVVYDTYQLQFGL